MPSAYEREHERKFVVTDTSQFWQMVESVDAARSVGSFSHSACTAKARVYRYFDTFSGMFREKGIAELYAMAESSELFLRRGRNDVIPPGILEKWGASFSARERAELSDCVLTVKIPFDDPKERDEYNAALPQTDLYSIDPNTFGHWAPYQKVKDVIGTVPLQEVVRLYVQTYRFDLYQGPPRKKDSKKVEVALDLVIAISYDGRQEMFCELEVERKRGVKEDITKVVDYFQRKYARYLHESPLPKWIKALRLLRGELIY